jgi:hypothetical protein
MNRSFHPVLLNVSLCFSFSKILFMIECRVGKSSAFGLATSFTFPEQNFFENDEIIQVWGMM